VTVCRLSNQREPNNRSCREEASHRPPRLISTLSAGLNISMASAAPARNQVSRCYLSRLTKQEPRREGEGGGRSQIYVSHCHCPSMILHVNNDVPTMTYRSQMQSQKCLLILLPRCGMTILMVVFSKWYIVQATLRIRRDLGHRCAWVESILKPFCLSFSRLLLEIGGEETIESKRNLFRFYNYLKSLLPNPDLM